ncbi:hypothetical protein FQA39_LY10148 [Lamprigera yunnana]|nr:hypothetical protein FQA39_LY10148 [Lamprigera yunnana]
MSNVDEKTRRAILVSKVMQVFKQPNIKLKSRKPLGHIDTVSFLINDDSDEDETFDTMWKPRQNGSKTLTFEMIEEKKILRIVDMCGNKVYLSWESVSEVWSLESVLSYRLSYSSGIIQFIKKMWMLYAEQHWTKAIDLKSAVKRLYEKLGALEFDADHEAIYGMERYYTVQQCEKLRDKYKIGRKVSKKFLKGKTCSQYLVKRMSEIGLRHFLDTINKYIKDCSDSDTSSSSDEEDCKAVEHMVKIVRRQKKKNKKKAKVEHY